MDKLDKKILTALSTNGWAGLKEIAKASGASLQRVSYRLERLEREKIIKNYYSIIDFSTLGYSSYRLMFKLSPARLSEMEKFVSILANNPNTLWAAECGGRWDFLVDLLAKDAYELEEIFSKISEEASGIEACFDFLVISQIFDWDQRKETSLKRKPKGILSGTSKRISGKDLQILKCIALNPRSSLKEVYESLKIDARTLRKRIDFLKRERILISVNPQLDFTKIGLEKFKILLKFQNSFAGYEEILKFIEANNSFVGAVKTIGNWDLEAECCVKNTQEAKELLYFLRKRFPNQVKDFEILQITSEYPYRFLPKKAL